MNANTKRQNDVNGLITKCDIFFAFSDKQFTEGKEKLALQAGEKLVSIGAGGFMPTKNVDAYIEGMKAIDNTFKEAMKEEKARKAHIKWELENHEAYYSRNIDSTMEALGEDFTREEVLKVFKGR